MKIPYLRALFPSMAIAISALAISSCGPMSNDNGKIFGALAGAAGGAAVGAVAGNQSGQSGEGALVGAGAGAMAGYQNGPAWFGGNGQIQQTRREEEGQQ